MNIEPWKRWFRVRPGYWFAPKLFGLGAVPVTWQGGLLVLAFVALLLLDVRFVAPDAARIAIGVVLVLAFIGICWRKTDGGWHWHWGPPE